MKPRVILDLCGGTGSWSAPYLEAGYDVRLITLPDHDVRLYEATNQVHGVLAAPPCTYFCRMRMCRGRPTDDQFREGLSVVDACLRVIAVTRPKWWALENPQGYLSRWLGQPRMKFDPWQFGDPWRKRTWLWGSFTLPREVCLAVPAEQSLVKWHTEDGQRGLAKNQVERSRTPAGFARAFFEANL